MNSKMSLRCLRLMRFVRNANTIRHSLYTTSANAAEAEKLNKAREYRTENNIIFYEDPDTFGTLSRGLNKDRVVLEDKDDIAEEEHIRNKPLDSQKLTIKQYSDIIKQYLKHKRLKEALNVLEVRMLKEDTVKPENYIYNILIGACADVGYTKKAFKLFNDMKRRALKPTGDTYTCLFHACYNSPWALDGLNKAKRLRELMIEKGIEPNLTNYNSMIKAFGKCGDLLTAFQIVDEMKSKKIKIRIHTFNHLLQACISDKDNGLRHALIVWRKMLKNREKPNIYSFNLMLKCVKECNMGSKEDIMEMLGIIQENMPLVGGNPKVLQIESKQLLLSQSLADIKIQPNSQQNVLKKDFANVDIYNNIKETVTEEKTKVEEHNTKSTANESSQLIAPENISIQIVQKQPKPEEPRTLPNLLSKNLQLDKVLSLQEVQTVQEKFAVIGGQEDFLREMAVYNVKPDIKTVTQMLPLLDDTREAEMKLLDTMKSLNLKADIDFYNMLIKKRCLRQDYDGAFEIKDIIAKESKLRKKHQPLKKKLKLQPNIMTFGVLAMACRTKESAETLLSNMKEEFLKVNIEILGTLLRQGTTNCNFGYVLYIMNLAKEEKVQINNIFLKHLEDFYQKCIKISKTSKSEAFANSFKIFRMAYKNWLNDINIDEVTKPEHPWAQFNNTYPETVQRQNLNIEEPKKFYKRNRKYVTYTPPL